MSSRALGGITIKRFRRHNFCQLWQLVLNKPGALHPIILILKTQLNQLERYHLRVLRQIQALRTASSAVYMLLGALQIEAEIHKRQLSLLHSVISSDNKCLSSKSTSLQLQQRVQIFSASLPMCWNIIYRRLAVLLRQR